MPNETTREDRVVQTLRDLGYESALLAEGGNSITISVDAAALIVEEIRMAREARNRIAQAETLRCSGPCQKLYPRHRLPNGLCSNCIRAAKEPTS